MLLLLLANRRGHLRVDAAHGYHPGGGRDARGLLPAAIVPDAVRLVQFGMELAKHEISEVGIRPVRSVGRDGLNVSVSGFLENIVHPVSQPLPVWELNLLLLLLLLLLLQLLLLLSWLHLPPVEALVVVVEMLLLLLKETTGMLLRLRIGHTRYCSRRDGIGSRGYGGRGVLKESPDAARHLVDRVADGRGRGDRVGRGRAHSPGRRRGRGGRGMGSLCRARGCRGRRGRRSSRRSRRCGCGLPGSRGRCLAWSNTNLVNLGQTQGRRHRGQLGQAGGLVAQARHHLPHGDVDRAVGDVHRK